MISPLISQVRQHLNSCDIRGFAGPDYQGSAPSWLPVTRCSVRLKNGADFLIAFEAGKVCQEFTHSERKCRPIIIIVSSDAGLGIITQELENAGIQSFLILNVAEIESVVSKLKC